jgi:prepilin-type N-terminal cleavage/methylation domain-containing protein
MNLRSSFTLIELLIVLAIVTILSVVVIVTLNPAELLRQSRDSNRLSDLATLNSALGMYNTDIGGSMGSSSVVYISIPDTTSTLTFQLSTALESVKYQSLMTADGGGSNVAYEAGTVSGLNL